MKKTTKSTIKKFIKENTDALFINVKTDLDSMTDGIKSCHEGFQKVKETKHNTENTLGIDGAWFVGSSRDYFETYSDNEFLGFKVWNSCGSFILAIKK